jgi:hypothetical protein
MQKQRRRTHPFDAAVEALTRVICSYITWLLSIAIIVGHRMSCYVPHTYDTSVRPLMLAMQLKGEPPKLIYSATPDHLKNVPHCVPHSNAAP